MKMPKGTLRWEPSPGIKMHDGRLPNGTPQALYCPDDHLCFPGFFKGMEQILHKHILRLSNWILKVQCGTSLKKCLPGQTTCCYQWILYNQEDFNQQKSLIHELYEGAGHLCMYYLKFHKLDFIEQYWGNAKFQYWETPFTNSEDEMMQNTHECLESVPVEFILQCAPMTLCELSTIDHILQLLNLVW